MKMKPIVKYVDVGENLFGALLALAVSVGLNENSADIQTDIKIEKKNI
jgi:hypothetical protein